MPALDCEEQMNVLTEVDRKLLPSMESTDGDKDALALVRFTNPGMKRPNGKLWEWFAIEFDGVDQFFGLVKGWETELGYFTISGDFAAVEDATGLAMVRDQYFQPTMVRDLGSKGHI